MPCIKLNFKLFNGSIISFQLYAPVQMSYENGELTVFNTNYFKNALGVLRVRTLERGREVAVKNFAIDVPAQTSRVFSLQEKGSFQVEYVENVLGVGDSVLA